MEQGIVRILALLSIPYVASDHEVTEGDVSGRFKGPSYAPHE